MKHSFYFLCFVLASTSCVEKSSDVPAERPSESVEKAPGQDADFVGHTLEEAEALASERGLKHRIVEKDGQSFPATADYNPNRVSFSVAKGKITKVNRG